MMGWKLRCHVFQGIVRTDLDTLGFSHTIALAKVADHGIVVGGWIESRHGRGTGGGALATGGPQATVDVDHHVELLLVIMDHRRVDRASLLAFPLFFWTLAANILH